MAFGSLLKSRSVYFGCVPTYTTFSLADLTALSLLLLSGVHSPVFYSLVFCLPSVQRCKDEGLKIVVGQTEVEPVSLHVRRGSHSLQKRSEEEQAIRVCQSWSEQ